MIESVAPSGESPCRGHILVVDDEPEVIRAMAQMVSRLGYEAVCTTETSQAALLETIVQKRGLCRAPHKPRYVEFRIMRSSFLDDGGLRAGS